MSAIRARFELVGDDVSSENWDFKVGQNSHSFLAWLAWYGPTRVLQKLLFAHAARGHPHLHWRGRAGLYVIGRSSTAALPTAGAKTPPGAVSSSSISRRDI